MVFAEPGTALAAITGRNHPAEQPIAQAIVVLNTFLGEVRISTITATSTISTATTVTRITVVAPSTVHPVCIATDIA